MGAVLWIVWHIKGLSTINSITKQLIASLKHEFMMFILKIFFVASAVFAPPLYRRGAKVLTQGKHCSVLFIAW